ncbi:phospholipase D [Aureobasidium sp. EXF-12298]|nr:phospholipase D [Aureobasidium sp. EXF-12298]
MQMVAEEEAPRSLSPIPRTRLGEGLSQPSSPLRTTFTPEVPTPAQTTLSTDLLRPPTAVSVHFGPPTPADFNLPSFKNFQNGSAPRSVSATSPRPRPFVLRHDSDPTLRTMSRNRDASGGSGTQTPPERRLGEEQLDGADEHGRQGSFFSRLKAMATPTHSRHPSEFTNASVLMTPTEELEEPHFPVYSQSQHDGSEAEGDIEESSMDEAAEGHEPRQKRKARRKMEKTPSAGPSTPRTPRFPSFLRDHADRTPRLPRRATMTDIPENSRAGVSEDEGRDRLAKSAWRRGLEGARGLSYAPRSSRPTNDAAEQSDSNRPTTSRRFTGLAGALDGSASPWRGRGERQQSTSAQKWKQVKAGLKLLGQRKKDERVKVDHQKSTELMAELLAGSPAAIFLASMYQRDEHGRRKIPVLLEQLKITIPSSQNRESKSGDRHMVFTINLEYGSGPSRMSWTIHRSLRDFSNLHLKYKFQSQSERYSILKTEDRSKAKIPRFPRSAFPYLRGVRGLADDEEEDDDNAIAEASGPDGEASGPERPGMKKRRRTSFALSRRKSSTGHASGPDGVTGEAARAGSIAGAAGGAKAKDLYNERQRRKLENYLQQMIRWLVFRPDSTRLCKFLELSALSLRLSVEGGYHGKEGLMSIISKPNIDLRRRPVTASVSAFKRNAEPKWFMIRHSYVVALDSPESLEPREVFLVDGDFTTDKVGKKRLRDQTAEELAKTAGNATQPKHHILRLYNSERKLKMLAKNERQLVQFQESIDYMVKNTIWSLKHRFDSFAPVRKNVFARWLVDGRDHMWQVSRAIDNARSFVYIHDWWLSPELYLRRPAAISQKWRLDRLLLRKAQEGVKIFVIVYRNIESAIPIDSEYTKASLLDLHPNVCVQRSPNQFRQNQFFWAHHEKLVVIDNAMAFVGGVDLCFGRWDDPHHSLTDDKLTGFELDMEGPRTADNCQVWPGKDYSNPRVQDFYGLDRPYEEMYDRTKVPRMPWHDIAMTIVGQPARDVARHFVQRWNYILRQRVPSRPTPILLPPPEFDQSELERLGMTGTCQIQILRSCTSWSIGTPNKTECSIMNAYVYLITSSEHFVYIENQFFISSCVVEGTQINNKIGDALVERIILAHERGDNWRACLIIPLMPGFQNQVDSQDGTSVRLIMQCQYRSICRGESSIFGRLRAQGIDPTQYIEFYALRQWGKIGPRKCLTTEQLYIHAKCMVVDDRSVIIGSANINERSMLGSRDSEVAAIVTDQEMIPSFMGGKPYDVGTFPHSLRMRLMREHLGVDVDEIYRRECEAERAFQDEEMERIYRDDFITPPETPPAHGLTEENLHHNSERDGKAGVLHNFLNETDNGNAGQMDGADGKKHSVDRPHDLDVAGFGTDNMKNLENVVDMSARDTYITPDGREVLKSANLLDATARERSSSIRREVIHHQIYDLPHNATEAGRLLPPPMPPRMNTRELGLTQLSQLPPLPVCDDSDIGGPSLVQEVDSENAHIINPLLNSMIRPVVDEDCMRDPLVNDFYKKIWHQVAENNTRIYRQVFRCMPDSEVQSWAEYRSFNSYNEKFMMSQGLGTSVPLPKPSGDAPDSSGPPGSGGTDALSSVANVSERASKHASNRFSGLSRLFGGRPSTSHSNVAATNGDMSEKSEKQGLDGGPRASDPVLSNGGADDAADEEPFDEKAAAPRNDTANTDATLAPPPLDGVPTNSSATTNGAPARMTKSRTIQFPEMTEKEKNFESGQVQHAATVSGSGNMQHSTSKRRRNRANTRGSMKNGGAFEPEILTKEEAESLLKLVQGHVVTFPYDWLEREEKGGNWLYNIDQLAPLEI